MSKRAIAAAMMVLGLTVGGVAVAAPASATVTSAEGGTFDYGVGLSRTWSNYHHPSKKHRSTACNNNSCSRSADAARNVWSYASIAVTLSNNRSYYFNY